MEMLRDATGAVREGASTARTTRGSYEHDFATTLIVLTLSVDSSWPITSIESPESDPVMDTF